MLGKKFVYSRDAEMVLQWGKHHDFPLPAEAYLPDIGFMVEDIACGFLYVTNSKLAWIEWVFANPEKHETERKEAIDRVFKLLEITASQLGYACIFSASSGEFYSKVLKRNDYQETDKNMSHFIKVLEEK